MPPNDNDKAQSDAEILDQESLAWVNRLLSGAVTQEQADAFTRWRQQSPQHDKAFTEAIRFQRSVRAAIQARRQAAAVAPVIRPRAQRPDFSRRALIGGGIAASVGGAGIYLTANPPGGLWPSWAELTCDYHTGPGQTRDIAAAAGVTLAMNTRTAIAVRNRGVAPGIQLISGEASIVAARPDAAPFMVAAGAGQAALGTARANVRNENGEVCITCLEGQVRVSHPEGERILAAGQALTYGHGRLGAAAAADMAEATAWQRGLLIFRDAPLQKVVDELNRYRNGRIVLVGAALARRPVYAVFHTNQPDHALAQVRALTGAHETVLPGGLVVLA